jgi:signal transduction histidine kinase
VTKKTIELMGGSLIVDSEPGIGSRFSLVIPLQPVNTVQ